MKHKQNHGFTIIEMVVVMVIIAILATLSAFGYMTVQQQSRDAKRQADTASLMSELDKFYEQNGEYPPICPVASADCTTWLLTDNTSAPLLHDGSSTADIRAVLPGLSSEFSEPRQDGDRPLVVDQEAPAKGYYIFSGTVNNRSSESGTSFMPTGDFPCRIGVRLEPGQVSSYVVGYYSEQESSWVLQGGKYGQKLEVRSGGCNII